MMILSEPSCRRGAFILLEGVDRCGKTTQAKMLLQRLLQMGIAAVSMGFPDRSTPTGHIINDYLQQQSELDDRSIHLLFSSNRWEAATKIQNLLHAGTTIVCDRYAYSGVAFSAAKVDSVTGQPLLDLEWCKAPDRGLPAPDCVVFLDLSADQAEARGGYGGERYEKRDLQLRVREKFRCLQTEDIDIPWTIVDASKPIEQVHDDVWKVVGATIQTSPKKPIGTMFKNIE